MRTLAVICLVILLSISFAISCGKKKASEEGEKEKVESPIKQIKDAAQTMKGINEAAKQMKELEKESGKIEGSIINWRDLVQWLPESIGDYTRDSDPRGESTKMMNFEISSAKANYLNGEKKVDIEIVDFAGNVGFPLYSAWTVARNFEHDSSDEYRKSVTINDIDGVEHYDYGDKKGELQLVVGKRFFIELKGKPGVPVEEVRTIAKALDYKQLEKLAEDAGK